MSGSVGDFGKKLLLMSLIDNTMDTTGDFTSQKIREFIREKTGVEIENEFVEDWLAGFNAITSMMVTSAVIASTTAVSGFLIDKATLSNFKNLLFNLQNFASTVSGMASGGSHINTEIILGKSQGSLSDQKLAHYTYMNTAIQARGAVLHNGSMVTQSMTAGMNYETVRSNNEKVTIPQGQKLMMVMEELKNMARQGI
ncbi:hypothetical protein NRK67_02500 [Fusobacteria bacterium ZRK30]|nr:hypothetical protein NRK67_02500 [Fusobacteria bacterium ZRK30]